MSSSCQLRPGKTTPSSLLLIPFKVQSARVYFFSETSQLILDTLPTVTRFLLLWQVTQKII